MSVVQAFAEMEVYSNNCCVNCGVDKSKMHRFNYRLRDSDYTIYEALTMVSSRFSSSAEEDGSGRFSPLQGGSGGGRKYFLPDPRLLCTMCTCKLKTWFESSLMFTNRTLKGSYLDRKFKSEWNGNSYPKVHSSITPTSRPITTQQVQQQQVQGQRSASTVQQPLDEDKYCHNCHSKSNLLLQDIQPIIEDVQRHISNSAALYTITNADKTLLKQDQVPNSAFVTVPLKLCNQCSEYLCGLYLFHVRFFKLTKEASKVEQLIKEYLTNSCFAQLQNDGQELLEVKTESLDAFDELNFMNVDCPLEEDGRNEKSASPEADNTDTFSSVTTLQEEDQSTQQLLPENISPSPLPEEEKLVETNAAGTVDGQEPLPNYVPFSTTEAQETYCDICKQEYGNPIALKDHQKIAHPYLSQSHRCPICRQYFFRGYSLTKHGRLVHNIRNILELMPKTQQPRPTFHQKKKTNKSILRSSKVNKTKDKKLTTNSCGEPKAKHAVSPPPEGLFCSSSSVVHPSDANNSVYGLEGPVLIQMPPSDTLDFIARTIFKPKSTELASSAEVATPSPGETERSEPISLLNPTTSISEPDLNIQGGIEDSTPLGAGSTTDEAVNRKPYRRIIKPKRKPRFTKKVLRQSSLTEAEAPFACTLCPNRYRTKYNLKYHLYRHEESPCICPICSRICASVVALRAHRYRCHKENFYECVTCPAKFSTFLEYSNHKKKFHAGKVNCKECGKLLGRNSLLTHRKLFCIKTSTTQICPQCGKSFKDLHKHIKNVHSLQASVKQFICEICGATFTTQSNMNIHIKTIHLVEEEFPCEICGKKFRHKCYLEKHSLIHNEIKKYECKVCKQKFAQPGPMHSHYIRRHGTEEEQGGPFECGVCGQVFRIREHLNNHKKREFHDGKSEEEHKSHYSQRKTFYSQRKKFRLERAQQMNMEGINVSEQEQIVINGKTCYQCKLCRKAVNNPKFSNELSLKFHKAYKHWEVLGLDKTAAANQSDITLDGVENDNNSANANASVKLKQSNRIPRKRRK